ncbi:hypothetical protein ACTS94_05035 [Empedobacter falsenii]
MKKWKKRIKRFLALWLKDELLDISGLNSLAPHVQTVYRDDFKELKVDFVLRGYRPYDSIDNAKQIAIDELFKEFIKHVKIESFDLLSPTRNPDTRIQGKIYVCKP